MIVIYVVRSTMRHIGVNDSDLCSKWIDLINLSVN